MRFERLFKFFIVLCMARSCWIVCVQRNVFNRPAMDWAHLLVCRNVVISLALVMKTHQ